MLLRHNCLCFFQSAANNVMPNIQIMRPSDLYYSKLTPAMKKAEVDMERTNRKASVCFHHSFKVCSQAWSVLFVCRRRYPRSAWLDFTAVRVECGDFFRESIASPECNERLVSQTVCKKLFFQLCQLKKALTFQTFLTEGHISYYKAVRWPDILRNVIVSRYVAFYQIKTFS